MNEERLDDIPDKEVTGDAPREDELELVGEEPEVLEEDTSDERAVEADMSGGGVELRSAEEIELEEEESGVAQ
ncbi:MAG: hypothetical protein H0U12_05615 [Thermoleophilaceae bacterium]|nr:hypothetical protein [Thermoleophilaceae bacterium]